MRFLPSQELVVHDNNITLGLCLKGPPVETLYMVLGLCSHDSSQYAPIAKTDHAHMWCDTTRKESHGIVITLGLSSYDPLVKIKYTVLSLSSHDSSRHAPIARTTYAHFWCDTTAKMSPRIPLQTRVSPAELYYLHHVRSSASSPRGASGTGSTPSRAFWNLSTPHGCWTHWKLQSPWRTTAWRSLSYHRSFLYPGCTPAWAR